jgi:hypothetical protein
MLYRNFISLLFLPYSLQQFAFPQEPARIPGFQKNISEYFDDYSAGDADTIIERQEVL